MPLNKCGKRKGKQKQLRIKTSTFFLIFRYNELFFMVDTCQAASLYEKFSSPNVLAVASSLVGEDSLSVRLFFKFSLQYRIQNSIFQHHVDPSIGVYMIDRYTYYALEFLEKVKPNSDKTMGEFVSLFLFTLLKIRFLYKLFL